MIKVEVKLCKEHGLEVYKVEVNHTVLSIFMSKEQAETKRILLQAKLDKLTKGE